MIQKKLGTQSHSDTGAKKKCFKCGRRKKLSHFYKHPQMKDGHVNKCIDCNKDDVQNNYRDNFEHYQQYEKNREQQPDRKADKLVAMKTHRDKNPDKYKARTAVNNAIRDGRLVRKSCVVGGCQEKSEAHHEDYSKPLEVIWMCRPHHRQHHRGQ